MKSASYDVELSLRDFAATEGLLRSQLSDTYQIEDRTKQGWGLVLRKAGGQSRTLPAAVDEFLRPLHVVRKIIASSKPTLRIAVFNSAATCTINLPDVTLLAELNVALEISMYPV